jgi:hypothetical protein
MSYRHKTRLYEGVVVGGPLGGVKLTHNGALFTYPAPEAAAELLPLGLPAPQPSERTFYVHQLICGKGVWVIAGVSQFDLASTLLDAYVIWSERVRDAVDCHSPT